MPVYFTFVRHGQTFNNVAGIIQSRTGGELTDRGKEMATCLGKLIADEEFTRIYSSDLNRCVQTTDHILKELKSHVPDVVYTPVLRERDYGDWELLSSQIKPVLDKISEMKLAAHEHHKIEVPNGETYEETRKRAARFFSEILKIVDEADENQSENILAVSHGILILCALENIVQSPELYDVINLNEEQLMKIRAENTCRTRMEISKVQPGEGHKRRITFSHVFDTEHYKLLSS